MKNNVIVSIASYLRVFFVCLFAFPQTVKANIGRMPTEEKTLIELEEYLRFISSPCGDINKWLEDNYVNYGNSPLEEAQYTFFAEFHYSPSVLAGNFHTTHCLANNASLVLFEQGNELFQYESPLTNIIASFRLRNEMYPWPRLQRFAI